MFGDRQRLLLLTTAVVALVALASVGLSTWHVHRVMGDAVVLLPWLDARLDVAERLLVGTALLVIIGGGALLLRVVTPFVDKLEASEARTQAIVAHAVEAILTVDSAGLIRSINPAGERLFGYEAPAVVGAHLKLLLPAVAGDTMSQPAACLRVEHGRRRDGSPVELELSVGQLPDERTPLCLVVARDITARRQAEERLQAQAQELQQANDELQTKSFELAQINRELNDFTYIATHDLKEPLRGIGAFCQMIVEDSGPRLDDEGRSRLATLQRLAVRLERLVDDLLKFARAGCCRPEMAPVDLHALLEDLAPTFAPLTAARQPSIRIVGRLPNVRGDATLLGEVFRNLVANGLKFNASPAPAIEIGCTAGPQAAFYVRDNGIGISPEHHETVFEMFRRLHGRAHYEGTGAGLAIVRKIVKSHGGRAWIESQPANGTTVWFTLPTEPTPTLAAPHFPLTPNALPLTPEAQSL